MASQVDAGRVGSRKRPVSYPLRALMGGIVSAILAGCISFGEPIPGEKVSALQVGVQDRTQVQQLLGPPSSQMTALQHHPKGCSERWSYLYAPSLDDMSSYRIQLLAVDFNVFGRVCDTTYQDLRQLPEPNAGSQAGGR